MRKRPLVPKGKIALVGAGGFGSFCLEAYQQSNDICVALIAEPNSGVDIAPDRRGEAQLVRDWKAILDDPSIEAVHLATPPHLRGDIAIPLLNAGKSVFCEKPLALSLAEADHMIRASRQTGSNLGIDYVLRHHPAFELLALLAASGLFGPLRALSLENFAQALPPNHWMWDEAVSGGILVEHGVHFLDAYGWLAGTPSYVWGSAPRREAVQITVQYAEGAIVTHYHEFAFPQAVERTHATLFFQQGYIEISGWIPARLSGKVVETIGTVESVLQRSQHPFTLRKEDGATWFDLQFPGRSQAYQSAIAGGMRELIARHRDPAAPMTVSAGNARESLALALAARQACVSGSVVQITETSSFEGGKFGSLGNERKRTLSQASAERGPPN